MDPDLDIETEVKCLHSEAWRCDTEPGLRI